MDEIEAQIDMFVVEDEYLQTPLLIGQNFTELPSITALKNSDALYFYSCPNSSEITDSDKTFKLIVLQDTCLTENGLIEVYTKEPYSGDIYIEGGTRTNPDQEYHLHGGCYKLENSKGVIFITVLNKPPLEFKAEYSIARARPATELKCLRVNTRSGYVYPPLDKNEIRTGEYLDNKTKDRLDKLLERYRDCFATNLQELGCTSEAEIKIQLQDSNPVVYRPYRLSFSEREKVREMVGDLLQNDIIQESQSDYASPILLVKKKNGEQRLCIDYRALNNKTTKDKYPLPIIDDQISILSGNKYFTTLDLASGYYQIPVAESSKHLTAFVTPDGHYEFKRMPFGLANAPAVFQRMINKILGARRFTYALAYMDDLLIPSATINEGFERLEEVLQLLQQAGLTLKLQKCSFFDETIEYLGYEISASGIRPSERKILAVKDFPAPRNVHEVRQFLGLASYFRKFVKGFGEIARPLTNLLKKNSVWQWTVTEIDAFNSLKSKLVDRPVLALYDPKLETELHTDASSLGLGGILMQWQGNPRTLKPVAYFSRQTTPEERHMHSYELETLAVVCSLKKFRVYLLGINFTVFTDCNALRTTLTRRDLIPRIARWWLQISEFNFKIEYRAGLKMAHVDALSRNPLLNHHIESRGLLNESPSVLNISSDNWMLTLQLADPELVRVTKVLKPDIDEESAEIKKNYVLKNNVLFRKVDDQLRLVVPKNARWQICRMNHDDVGHFGIAKTLERVKNKYWFPKMRKFIKKYVSACISCAYNKDSSSRVPSGHLHPIDKVGIPFHTLHLDHVGPFVRSKRGNSYILTIVDGFTKYLFARPVRDTKTKSVIRVLEDLFNDFAVPVRIISDRGTAFTSSQFQGFCSDKGIKHILNAVACPRANGQAERFNQTILTSLSTQNFDGNEKDWDKALGKVQWGVNNTVNASTKKCPSELLFGMKFSGPTENCIGVPDSTNVQNVDNIKEVRIDALHNIRLNQQKQKDKHDLNRIAAPVYQVGDLVKIVKNSFRNDGKSTKLLPKFIGPYKVIKSLGNDRYKIGTVPGFQQTRLYESVVAADRMRPWIHFKALDVDNNSSDSENSDTQEDSEK